MGNYQLRISLQVGIALTAKSWCVASGDTPDKLRFPMPCGAWVLAVNPGHVGGLHCRCTGVCARRLDESLMAPINSLFTGVRRQLSIPLAAAAASVDGGCMQRS
eukprot:SAG31_NODE_26792_length_436_cov_1.335312_1_plen_104_part_00